MQTVVQPIAQCQRNDGQTPAITARLGCVSGIYSNYLNTGTFSLVRENCNKPRPTGIVARFSKIQGANHAFDIQIFVCDLAKFLHQIKSSFVVKVTALVLDVLGKLGKMLDGFSSIGASPLLSRNGALKPFQLLLSLPVELRRLDFIPVGIYEEGLQPKINTNARILRRLSVKVWEDTGDDDIPTVSLFLESCRLKVTKDRAVHLDFDITDSHEASFAILGELCAVTDSELNRIESAVPSEARIAGCPVGVLSCFDASKEGLHCSVKTSKRSLARGEVSTGKIGIDFPVLSQLRRLLFVSNRPFFTLIKVFSLRKCLVIQMPMRIEQRQHSLFLLFTWIRAVFVCFLHYVLIDTPLTKSNPEKKEAII